MLDRVQNFINHTPDEIVVAYVGGTCSPEESMAVEEHSTICEECRIKLLVMLDVCYGEESEETLKDLEPLFQIGLEAAALARKQIMDSNKSDFDVGLQCNEHKDTNSPGLYL